MEKVLKSHRQAGYFAMISLFFLIMCVYVATAQVETKLYYNENYDYTAIWRVYLIPILLRGL